MPDFGPTQIVERETTCLECKHYLPESTACLEIRRRHPGKAGNIYHQNGIYNRCARCPFRYWDIIPTDESLIIKSIYSISDTLFLTINRSPPSAVSLLTWTNRLYVDNSDTPRSEIMRTLSEVYEISSPGND